MFMALLFFCHAVYSAYLGWLDLKGHLLVFAAGHIIIRKPIS